MDISQINFVLAALTIAGQVGIVALLADHFFAKGKYMGSVIAPYSLWIAFLVAAGASLGSLYYSEIVGYMPCGLCWFQRIFLYPQVFIFGFALWKKDHSIYDYGILLSLFGGLIALYHHYIQMGGSEFVDCPAAGGDCGKLYILEFGYVTFPMMALVSFALIATVLLISRRR